MRHTQRLTTEAHFADFVNIAANAYPGIKIVTDEDKQKLKQRLLARAEDPTVAFYGLFDEERLLGGMRVHDFMMNMRSTTIKAGGVGFVAVDLLHKKEGVAKELLSFFLGSCRQRGQHLALLYPFRPDFYKKMGFGYGTKMSQYKVKPADLPKGPTKAHIRMLAEPDKQLLADCYQRYVDATHGLIAKSAAELNSIFSNPENRVVGCKRDGVISGYIVFTFKTVRPDTFLINDILVKELVYENREALAELLTFLHTQADQIRQIIFNLQDDTFHHLLFDPRDGVENTITDLYQQSNSQGVGIMYRAVNLVELLGTLGASFGAEPCKLKIGVQDSFLPENDGDVVVHFEGGAPAVRDGGDHEVAIHLDVAELSSLLMGVVSFRKLYSYGLAQISDPAYVDTITSLFRTEDKPLCMTWF